MKTKLVKAYRTAWRWPEIYQEPPSVVWSSRAITVVVPLVIVVLTFLVGVPLFGWAITTLLAAFISVILIIITVGLFYREYDTVEDHETRENRIQEYFHGFPAHTDVPLIESEPGDWIAYGHVDPHEFIEAIRTVILHVTEDQALADTYSPLEGSVGHLYATFKHSDEKHWSDGLNFCKPSEADCFPITRVEL